MKKLLNAYPGKTGEEVALSEGLSEKQINYFNFLRLNSEILNKPSILAWDLGRMTSLIRWGYQAGYLEKEEAWNMMLYFGGSIQKQFSSWEEYMESYAKGRIYWASGLKKEDQYQKQTDEITQKLLAPEGYLSSIPWETALPEARIYSHSEEEVQELKEKIRTYDGYNNVSRAQYASVYTELGNYYFQNDQYSLASELYSKSLKLNSREWDTQLRQAWLEMESSQEAKARTRLDFILENCYSGLILKEAEFLKKDLPAPVSIEVPDNSERSLILHIYGPKNDSLIAALKNSLEKEFKISVIILSKTLPLDTTSMRDKEEMVDRYCGSVVRRFKENYPDEYEDFFKALGKEGELNDKEKRVLVAALYGSDAEGRKAWADFQNNMEVQYNANTLLSSLFPDLCLQ